ncbi:MAG: hypothetical protein WCA77_03935 [Thermoplasmata archaeon]
MDDPGCAAIARAVDRDLVLALGGYVVELPGAHLVVDERIAAPRFNFVQVAAIAPSRQAAFFERTLDHYFQRALRPCFRVPPPVPSHVDRALRGFGFQPRAHRNSLLIAEGPIEGNAGPHARVAHPDELDRAVGFWSGEAERAELRRALEVALEHPNVGEHLEILFGLGPDGEPAAALLLLGNHDRVSIHAVATQPLVRGQGLASDLVRFARTRPVADGVPVFMDVDDRAAGRLATLGFRGVGEEILYELPPGAELALPAPGPPSPPRWRPPRSNG